MSSGLHLCELLGLPCECRRPGRPQTRPHGTRAAYARHYRHGEQPCETCRQWWRRWWQDTGRAQREARRAARRGVSRQAAEVPRAA